jgi:hypothetical protein
MFSISIYLEICELAMKNGKKAGDNIEEEFMEILKQKPQEFTYLGSTNQDLDLLCGNLRERGLKILNLAEFERRRENAL